MNLGAEPKKVAALGGIVVLGIILYFWNQDGDSTPARTGTPRTAPAAVAQTKSTAPPRTRAGRASGGDFKPRLGAARPEDRVDPATIDPELRLDLLAKVQAEEPAAAGRNLFQFGAAPAAVLPPLPKNVQKIAVNPQPIVQPPPTVTTNQTPPPPQAPPINMKYYGYKIRKSDGQTEAFLLDGEEILVAFENQTIKQRYRIVKIAQKSITIEDTQFRSTQTLQLQDLPS